MFSKLTLLFVAVFVTGLHSAIEGDDTQSFIDSGEKQMAEKEKAYDDFAAGGNYDEQTLRTLMNVQMAWRTQIEDRQIEVKNKLTLPQLTADEKAKLQNDMGLLTTAYFKVFLADHLNIHVVFDHVQASLSKSLDVLKSNDIGSIKNNYNTLLKSLKDVTDDIKIQGGKSLGNVKDMIAAAKPSRNWDSIEYLQVTMHINDGILHVMSELALEKANMENILRCAEKLLPTLSADKKAALLEFMNGLKAQIAVNSDLLPQVENRLNTDL